MVVPAGTDQRCPHRIQSRNQGPAVASPQRVWGNNQPIYVDGCSIIGVRKGGDNPIGSVADSKPIERPGL